MKKSKLKYLRDALLGNFLYIPLVWWIIDNTFILKHDENIIGIAVISWLLLSMLDARIAVLKDELKDLNDKLS